ncbi:MAG: heat-shock protein Hsp20 [Vicingaceae bacterium]|nr:MAG: heat-shock protein Hsp20 [Vicingaceae bacterium]
MKTLMKRNDEFMPGIASIFDEFFGSDWLPKRTVGFNVPAVNVKETDKSFEIEMAVPGMKKEDLNIDLENDVLTIWAEQKDEKEDKNENYTRREFHYSSFRRSFQLPEQVVDAKKIDAEYKDGILYIHIPKKQEAIEKGTQKISIR